MCHLLTASASNVAKVAEFRELETRDRWHTLCWRQSLMRIDMWLGWSGVWTSLLALLGALNVACSRTAQIAPHELSRLHAYPRNETDAPVPVRTLEGRTVEIRRSFTLARVVPREGTGAPETVLHPPFRAQVFGDVLLVEDREPFSYQPYRLADVENVDVVQRDASRAMPLLYGALIGASLGALIGVTTGNDCPDRDPSGESGPCYGRAAAAGFGATILGGLGILVAIPFTVGNKYY
jgi:hypothetical protein